MSLPRLLGLVVLSLLGCARSATDQDPVQEPAVEPLGGAPSDETGEEADAAAEPQQTQEETVAADPQAEHITFDGPEAEPGPADQVVAPPKRPPMPSMMTDVLKTGPRPRL